MTLNPLNSSNLEQLVLKGLTNALINGVVLWKVCTTYGQLCVTQ